MLNINIINPPKDIIVVTANISPPYIVISVLVVKAYKVNDSVTPNVIKAAITTNLGLLVNNL